MKTRLILLSLLVLAVVTAGLGSFWFLVRTSTNVGSSPIADGPTLDQAAESVNESIENLSGGPWALFSVYGVAAQAPFSADVISYPLNNQTANACQAQFNGLTLWNGTIPVFTGTLDSGTAPFWQFAYYSDSDHQIVLATNVLGSVHLYPSMSTDATCHPWYDLGNPESWVQQLSPFLPNSPAVARSALDAIDQRLPSQPSPTAEIFTSGPGVFVGFGDLGGQAGVIFDRCGLAGVTGIQPVLQWGESLQGISGSLSNETTNCAMLNRPYFAGYGSYEIVSAAPTGTNLSGATQVSFSFQVALLDHNQTAPTFFDGWGLANWMTSWNLTNSSGAQLAFGPSTCDSWVPSISDCRADSTGWYAVILSQSGDWINSYGLQPNGTRGWAQPVTALVSQQQLVIVAPRAWNLGGDTLAVSSTVATSTVVGLLSL